MVVVVVVAVVDTDARMPVERTGAKRDAGAEEDMARRYAGVMAAVKRFESRFARHGGRAKPGVVRRQRFDRSSA
jgi:hypothetical protein